MTIPPSKISSTVELAALNKITKRFGLLTACPLRRALEQLLRGMLECVDGVGQEQGRLVDGGLRIP